MIFNNKVSCFSLIALAACALVSARDAIFEFKGAYFLPTNCAFKSIYDHGSAIFGPELTVQLCDTTNWYAFGSVDYFQKKGKSVGLNEPTRVQLIPIAAGLKYLYPICNENIDLYAGLGFEAVNVRTTNCTAEAVIKLSQWALGGIAKAGAFWYLPCNFVLDVFIDYSFAKTSGRACWCPAGVGVKPVKANVSGALFGIGIGYRF